MSCSQAPLCSARLPSAASDARSICSRCRPDSLMRYLGAVLLGVLASHRQQRWGHVHACHAALLPHKRGRHIAVATRATAQVQHTGAQRRCVFGRSWSGSVGTVGHGGTDIARHDVAGHMASLVTRFVLQPCNCTSFGNVICAQPHSQTRPTLGCHRQNQVQQRSPQALNAHGQRRSTAVILGHHFVRHLGQGLAHLRCK